MNGLFKEFSPVTAQQWKEQIVKDLKGVDFNQLVYNTNNGFPIKPFYTAEDLKEKKTPLFTESDWDVCEQITVKDEKKANERALMALQGGASGLSFYIHEKIDITANIPFGQAVRRMNHGAQKALPAGVHVTFIQRVPNRVALRGTGAA